MGWVLAVAVVLGLLWWIGFSVIGATIGGMLAALAVFFAVGSWPFWFVVVLTLGAIWYLEESGEDGALAVIPFIAFCLFVHFISRFDLLAWGRENLGWLVWRAAAYLLIGFAYAFVIRWFIHLDRKRKEIDGLEVEFRRQHAFSGPLDQAPAETKFAFTEFIQGRYNADIARNRNYEVAEEGVKPKFSRNTYTLLRWFWWWPFSILGFLLNDLLREAWVRLKRLGQRIADGLSGLVFGRRAGYVLAAAEVAEFKRRRRSEEEDGYRRTRDRQE